MHRDREAALRRSGSPRRSPAHGGTWVDEDPAAGAAARRRPRAGRRCAGWCRRRTWATHTERGPALADLGRPARAPRGGGRAADRRLRGRPADRRRSGRTGPPARPGRGGRSSAAARHRGHLAPHGRPASACHRHRRGHARLGAARAAAGGAHQRRALPAPGGRPGRRRARLRAPARAAGLPAHRAATTARPSSRTRSRWRQVADEIARRGRGARRPAAARRHPAAGRALRARPAADLGHRRGVRARARRAAATADPARRRRTRGPTPCCGSAASRRSRALSAGADERRRRRTGSTTSCGPSRTCGFSGLLPHRRRGRRADQGARGAGRGPRVGRRQPGQPPARHLRGRPDPARPADGAVPVAAAPGAARHRHRRRVRASRGDLPVDLRPLRHRAHGLRVDDGDLPRAACGARCRRRPGHAGRARSTPSPSRSRTSGPAMRATPSPTCPSCAPPASAGWPPPGGSTPSSTSSRRLDGLPRHVALHPCGVLLSDPSLLDRTPVERSAAGFPMSHFDKDDVEEMGLLKLDVLGIRMQSSMAHALDEIERTTGERIELDDHELDDPATFALVAVGADPRLLPDRVARPARAHRQVRPGDLRRPHHRHLAVPARPGEVRHGHPVPAGPAGLERAGLPARRPAAGAGGDLRGGRLPRAGAAHRGDDDRLLARRGRRDPAQHGLARRPGRRAGLVLPGRAEARLRPADRRAGVGRAAGVRLLRLLQGARGGVRAAHLPVGLAEGPSSGGVLRRHPHPRPGHVPEAADPRRCPQPRCRGARPGHQRLRRRLPGRT